MSDFTIEQLEALKEETTPGPWEWSDHRVPDLIGDGLWPIVIEADHDGGRMGDCTLELHIKDEDKRLLAAAPALVDALIAEKQAHQETLHLVRELWSDVHHHGNVGRASILRHLAHILEATDE